jgi:NTP pyrophosphatase (non-canonical NTP hydrolase)
MIVDKNFGYIAEEANKLEDDIGISLDAVMHKITQEAGEFNDAVQKYRGIYCKSEGSMENVKSEAGDLMLNFISVLYRLKINPDELVDYASNTLDKFNERKELYISQMKKNNP